MPQPGEARPRNTPEASPVLLGDPNSTLQNNNSKPQTDSISKTKTELDIPAQTKKSTTLESPANPYLQQYLAQAPYWVSGSNADEGRFANTAAPRGALRGSQPDDEGIRFRPWTDDTSMLSEPDPLPISNQHTVNAERMQQALASHPNAAFVSTVLTVLREGMLVGAKGYDASVPRRHQNLKSALRYPDPVRKWLADEVAAGRLYGPVQPRSTRGNRPGHLGRSRRRATISAPSAESSPTSQNHGRMATHPSTIVLTVRRPPWSTLD